MNTVIVSSNLPLRWKGVDYQVLECGLRDGKAYAAVIPNNAELVSELERRIKRDQGLSLYHGCGFTRFVDDVGG